MRPLRYAWAFFPNTLVGLVLATSARVTGGGWRIVAGVLEAHGGAVAWLLRHAVPLPRGAAAITFGHVVLGRDAACLDRTRGHERVHVRQYERWGPLFLPAYGLSSLAAWRRGGHAYRDNRFEREAFARCVDHARAKGAGETVGAGETNSTAAPLGRDAAGGLRSGMSEAEPKFSDPVGTAGSSRIWLPILAVLFLFLITAAAVMLIGSLASDAGVPASPSAPVEQSAPADADPDTNAGN